MRRLTLLVAKLLSAGAIAQILSMVTGLALLRWLSVEEFAQYSIAFGFGATVCSIVDAGFAGAVMPLVGASARDGDVVGAYLRAALHLRRAVAAFVVPASAIAFFALTDSYHWGVETQLSLLATVLVTLAGRAWFDVYSLPLLLNGAYREFYAPQIAGAIGRLAIIGLLHAVLGLSGITAAAIGALTVAVNGLQYRRRARAAGHVALSVDLEHVREIRRLATPQLPNLLFAAFQGQITILLIALSGNSAATADIGALARLTAIFVLFGSLNQTLIGPRFPQLVRERVLPATLKVLMLAGAVGAFFTMLGFLFPAPFLLLLGPNYDDLDKEVAWFLTAASVGYLGAVLFAINLARRFVWWWTTWLGLGLIVAVQLTAAAVLDLGDTLELQYFAVATAVAALSAQVVAFVNGLRVDSVRAPP